MACAEVMYRASARAEYIAHNHGPPLCEMLYSLLKCGDARVWDLDFPGKPGTGTQRKKAGDVSETAVGTELASLSLHTAQTATTSPRRWSAPGHSSDCVCGDKHAAGWLVNQSLRQGPARMHQ